jgi:predicted DsbA family dithiol-disulfide isomerase
MRADVRSGVKVEIWSDVVCPWCYIGKRRFEGALQAFPHSVEVIYRSFELDPSAPVGGAERSVDSLARKFGGHEQVTLMQQRVTAAAAEEGLTFHLEQTLHVNTIDAHRVLHLALDETGAVVQARLKEALMAAHFEEGRNLSDHAVLREIAVVNGLDGARVDEVLAGREYDQAVAADIAQATAYGATGVPFFVIDERYGVSGAQPTEVFAQVLAQAWAEAHPLSPAVMAAGDGEVCGPDGCA